MLLKLSCVAQPYEWGKIGAASEVANLSSAGDATHFKLDSSKPYAELWMGTHPKGPSRAHDSGQLLSDVIDANPSVLGAHENGGLQFLFKVLSVNKALSIQSHPNKDQAKVLHANDPTNYPDDNHKPEMAIALTPFELLCGFRPASEIAELIQDTPELVELIGNSKAVDGLRHADESEQKTALRTIFTAFMNSSDEQVKHAVSNLVTRLKANCSVRPFPLKDLLLRLNDQFPGDIGVFAPIFLNYFTLQPGEACFLGPNEPHAYLSGDCIECMACSDNTIRAGLTPKFKDVATLCSSLTYRMAAAERNRFESEHPSKEVTIYAPPVPEFAVHRIHDWMHVNETAWTYSLFQLPRECAWTLSALPSASILIVVHGEATLRPVGADTDLHAKRGDIFFISARTETAVSAATDFDAYRAFTPPSL